MPAVLHDLRYALRMARRHPGFTAGALMMLALGIGANTAIFTLLNAAVLRPLPYPDADRLVRVWGARIDVGEFRNPINPNDAADWRRGSQAVEALGVSTTTTQPLTGAGDPVLIPVTLVTSGFLEALQIPPAIGRLFGPEHDRPGRDSEIVVTDGFWRRVLGGDPRVLGRSVRLADVTCTIIGVLPPEFVSPGMRAGAEPQIWRPLVVAPDNRGGHFTTGVARLKPGVSLAEAEAQMNAVAERLSREFPSTNLGQRAALEPLRQAIAGDTRPALLLLMAAVGVVLVIACANVANLLLARATARAREFAVRTALGATRGRLVGQLLTESLVLGAAASVAGLGLGWLLLKGLPAWLAEQLPTILSASMDARVLSFGLALAMLTVVLFGLVPALAASRHDLRGTLAAGSPGGGGGPRRFQSGLVVVEAALALIMLVSATFLVQSLLRLQRVDPGFTTAGTLTFRLALPRTRYPDPVRGNAFFNTLLERIGAEPGVTAAGGVNTSPLSGRNSCDSFGLRDRPAPPPGQEPCAEVRAATPGYFTAMGIRLVSGRYLSEADNADTERVAVISESMARRYWPAGNALGQRLKWGSVGASSPWLTIVGVIGDVKHFGLNEEAPDEVYMPMEQRGTSAITFAVRMQQAPAALSGRIRAIVNDLDSALPVAELFTTRELVSRSMALPAFRTQLLTAFAVLALLLAVSGVYGVVSFQVAQRQREMGIRLALGATPGEVKRLVVGRGMNTVALGCALGVLAAYPLMRLMQDTLFGVAPGEPLPYVIAPAILLSTALLASYLPARRTTAFDPADTIRRD
jgi:putative ABC transport system permease protein